MKIGVLTYHSAYNFGANLQAYTIVKYLESKGHDPLIIDYTKPKTNERYRRSVPEEQWPGHENFFKLQFPLTRHVENKHDMCNLIHEISLDGIIVGSDAVWSYPGTSPEIPVYFMDWLFKDSRINHIPVASLSVANMSNGFKHLTEERISELKQCLLQFKYITVRDQWTKKVIQTHLFKDSHIDLNINPDPVFCIDPLIHSTWDSHGLIDQNDKYILVTLGKSKTYSSWIRGFKKRVNQAGYLLGELPILKNSGVEVDFTVPFPIDPLQWYLWIKNAHAYVGIRFHATVSCITAGTPFLSVDSYGNRNMINNVINKLGFYRLGRLLDYKSKIFNLLKETPFKDMRVNSIGLGGIHPSKTLEMLESIQASELRAMQEKNCRIFESHITSILHEFDTVH